MDNYLLQTIEGFGIDFDDLYKIFPEKSLNFNQYKELEQHVKDNADESMTYAYSKALLDGQTSIIEFLTKLENESRVINYAAINRADRERRKLEQEQLKLQEAKGAASDSEPKKRRGRPSKNKEMDTTIPEETSEEELPDLSSIELPSSQEIIPDEEEQEEQKPVLVESGEVSRPTGEISEEVTGNAADTVTQVALDVKGLQEEEPEITNEQPPQPLSPVFNTVDEKLNEKERVTGMTYGELNKLLLELFKLNSLAKLLTLMDIRIMCAAMFPQEYVLVNDVIGLRPESRKHVKSEIEASEGELISVENSDLQFNFSMEVVRFLQEHDFLDEDYIPTIKANRILLLHNYCFNYHLHPFSYVRYSDRSAFPNAAFDINGYVTNVAYVTAEGTIFYVNPEEDMFVRGSYQGTFDKYDNERLERTINNELKNILDDSVRVYPYSYCPDIYSDKGKLSFSNNRANKLGMVILLWETKKYFVDSLKFEYILSKATVPTANIEVRVSRNNPEYLFFFTNSKAGKMSVFAILKIEDFDIAQYHSTTTYFLPEKSELLSKIVSTAFGIELLTKGISYEDFIELDQSGDIVADNDEAFNKELAELGQLPTIQPIHKDETITDVEPEPNRLPEETQAEPPIEEPKEINIADIEERILALTDILELEDDEELKAGIQDRIEALKDILEINS